PAGDLVAQRKVLPAQVWRDDDDPFLAIERSRRPDADPEEIGSLGAGFLHCLGNDLLDHPCNTIDDRFRASLGECRRRVHGDLAAAVDGHRAGDDVGAAEVHSDYVALLHTHTGTGGLRTSVSKLEM